MYYCPSFFTVCSERNIKNHICFIFPIYFSKDSSKSNNTGKHKSLCMKWMGFPSGLVVKNPPANAGDTGGWGLIPGSGISPGGEHGSPLQYSCQENPMDREEPGGLQSMGLQRVRYDWSNLAWTHAQESEAGCHVVWHTEQREVGPPFELLDQALLEVHLFLAFPVTWANISSLLVTATYY